jgi:hypothetical protein
MFTVVFNLRGDEQKVFSFIEAASNLEAIGQAVLVMVEDDPRPITIEEVEVYSMKKEL